MGYYISDISLVYIRYVPGTSLVYLKYITGISQVYIMFISGILQIYSWHTLGKFQAHLANNIDYLRVFIAVPPFRGPLCFEVQLEVK